MLSSQVIDQRASNSNTIFHAVHLFARIVRLVTIAIFVIVAGLTILFAALSTTTNGATLPVFGRGLLVVKSGSMSPSFNAGDAVLVRQLSKPRTAVLDAGTVVTFTSPENDGLLITHRIVEIRTLGHAGPTYITKGDSNETLDATPLTIDRLIGVVSHHIPRGGYALYALQQPQILGMTFIALVLAQTAVLATRMTVPQTERGSNENHQ